MNLLSDPDFLVRAKKAKGMNQNDFSKEIGKSQAQLSKYLTGKTKIPNDIFIHCTNIIRKHNSSSAGVEDLLYEVLMLDGDAHSDLRDALMKMIIAYKRKSGSEIV